MSARGRPIRLGKQRRTCRRCFRPTRSRWPQVRVQAGFVDEPRRSVKEADQLVAQLMQQLAEGFSRERDQLESRWDHGDDVPTEDLRVVL